MGTEEPTLLMQSEVCQNCRAPLTGRFCASCGQDNRLQRLTFRQVLSETADELFKLELPIARTVTELAWRPGWVAAQYVEGRRRTFTNPLKYCLLLTAISLIALQIWPAPEIDPETATVDGEPDEFLAAWFQALNEMQEWVTRYAAIITLLLLPLLTALSRLFFLRSGRNFAEHYVLGLYIHGQWYLLTLLLLPLITNEIVWAAILGQLVIIPLYGLAAIHFFPGRTWIKAVLGGLAAFLYLLAFHLIYYAAAFVIVMVQSPEVFTNG